MITNIFSESIPDGSGSFHTENEDIDDTVLRLLQSSQFKERGKSEGYCLFCNSIVDEACDELICLAMTCLTEFIRRNPKKAAPLVPQIIHQFSSYALDGSVEVEFEITIFTINFCFSFKGP